MTQLEKSLISTIAGQLAQAAINEVAGNDSLTQHFIALAHKATRTYLKTARVTFRR